MPTITVRLNESNMKELDVIRNDVAKILKTTPDQITYTACIKYAIGSLSDMIELDNKTTS